MATLARASEQTKKTAASIAGGTRPTSMSRSTGTGTRSASTGRAAASPPWSSADGRMPWAKSRSSAWAARISTSSSLSPAASTAGAAQPRTIDQPQDTVEPALRSFGELPLEPATLVVNGLDDAPTRLGHLGDPSLDLGLQAGVRDRESGSSRDGGDQPRVVHGRRVVDQDGHSVAASSSISVTARCSPCIGSSTGRPPSST